MQIEPAREATSISSLAWSGDGMWFAYCVAPQGQVKILDVANGKAVSGLQVSNGSPERVAFLSDRRLFITQNANQIAVWNVVSSKREKVLAQAGGGHRLAIALSHDRRYLAIMTGQGHLQVWRVH